MSRCPECGFMNTDDATTCNKCGSSLSASGSAGESQAPQGNAPSEGAKTVMGSASNNPSWDQPNQGGGNAGGAPAGSKTVVGGSSNMPAWDGPSKAAPPSGGGDSASAPNTGNAIKCPSCGFYPLRSEPSADSPCPNCGNTGEAKAAQAEKPAAGGDDKLGAAPKGAAKTMMLSDLSPDEEETPAFSLVDEKSQKSHDFEGEHVTLNREVLDKDNMSISGSEHVQMKYKDGKWYLKDVSSNGATFIQVSGDVELLNNTKILLGNKIYTFKSE